MKKLKRNKTHIPRPSSARRRSSTVSAAVSLKQTWRRMSSGSVKKSSDITELSLKVSGCCMYIQYKLCLTSAFIIVYSEMGILWEFS